MTRESLKTRIAALLAKAEGTDNEFEAASFMAKVNELLEKHQIEMHEIRATSGDKDPMGKEDGETKLYASMTWARDVAGALALFYGCKFVFWRQGNHFPYATVGRASARQTFELMLPFVISQVRQRARKFAAERGITSSVAEREIGQALWIRIHDLVRAAEESRENLAGKGLIPVSDLDAAMAEFFPVLKKGKARTATFSSSAREEASRIGIQPQATNKSAKLLS